MAAGCMGLFRMGDGYLGVDGQVYQWAEPPTGTPSKVLVDSAEGAPPGEQRPIEGCDIVVEPWAQSNRPKSSETVRLWSSRGRTNKVGGFSVGGTAKPSKYEATIYISCPGFKPAIQGFRHGGSKHKAVAFMVREESPK